MANDESEIRNVVYRWFAGCCDEESPLADTLSHDAVLYSASGPVTGRDAILSTPTASSVRPRKIAVEAQQATVKAEVAYCASRLSLTYPTTGGGVATYDGQCFMVLERGEDASWRIARIALMVARTIGSTIRGSTLSGAPAADWDDHP
ncbi:MAG: nuclear transport factor 2 family protein [Polyangiaceae bacterium]|nr:nuclear transport factor 2 family protein [Polyangiaceae bacterium]